MATDQVKEDREAIIDHIHDLFQAFIRKDREAIRRGHTADWRGFQVKSRHIVRGLDEYMQAADRVLETMNSVRYELVDTEVQVEGDRAVVFYVARVWLRDAEGDETVVNLRSIDLYRREAAGWNQCGSHIGIVPGEDE
ncbi:MAG: nuclear transport factor 2 family protein [bacterium]|nr:nuclear transport factor 2 family protein [bacterium]